MNQEQIEKLNEKLTQEYKTILTFCRNECNYTFGCNSCRKKSRMGTLDILLEKRYLSDVERENLDYFRHQELYKITEKEL